MVVSCFTIVGCDNKNKSVIDFNIDNQGNYTGFDKIKDYTRAKEAIADGCYVKNTDDFKGTKYWETFLDEASKGNDTQLRMVILLEDGTSEYTDLFYHDGLYYAFRSATGDLSVKGYKYLLILEDSKVVNNKTAYTVVFSNDDTLTFADIMDDLFSSKSVITDNPYKIIFHGTKST